MKKSELKKILKPLVQECIKESLLEDGLISGIIAEVVKGVSVGTRLLWKPPLHPRRILLGKECSATRLHLSSRKN